MRIPSTIDPGKRRTGSCAGLIEAIDSNKRPGAIPGLQDSAGIILNSFMPVPCSRPAMPVGSPHGRFAAEAALAAARHFPGSRAATRTKTNRTCRDCTSRQIFMDATAKRLCSPIRI